MADPAPILCLESSSPQGGSWALCLHGHPLQSGNFSGRASSALPACLAPVLPFSRPPAEIRVGVGPGSFSGIRAALALAQGLALPWKATVQPIRSTHSIGLQYPNVSFLGVFSDARRGQLFVTCYTRGRLARPSQVIPRDHLPLWLAKCTLAVSTDGFDPTLPLATPHASHLAWPLDHYGEHQTLPAEPIHLRPPLATP
ncbi:MAG: hypothetical protein SNJ84_08185 [Verrucomicrobiia bacterium]